MSLWMLLSFFVIVGLAAFVSDFFQAPTFTSKELNQYRLLFRSEEVGNPVKVVLKNRLGSYVLKLSGQLAGQDMWNVVEPRVLPASSSPISSILTMLNNIKIRKIYSKDPINTSNFSLDDPNFSLEITNAKNELFTLKLGLVNPIDNSTYITVSNRDAIYHIDALENNLESIELNQLIDSRVFLFSKQTISKFNLYKFRGEQKNSQLSILRKGDTYTNEKNSSLSVEKVSEYFGKITGIRSQFILDELSEDIQKTLDKYEKKPVYQVEIETLGGEKLSYNISQVIKRGIQKLKIEKRQFFLITSKHLLHPYLVNREHLKLFSLDEKKLRASPIKKLFY